MSHALLVEDDQDVAEAVAAMLEYPMGFQVTWLQDVSAAIAAITDDCVFDLAVIDYWLEAGQSMEIAESAKAKGIAVCFTTGDMEVAELLSSRGYQTILKPFTIKAFQTAIRQASKKPGYSGFESSGSTA